MQKRGDFKELASKSLCPCESGKQYRSCCKGKEFKWECNKKGDVRKVVKVYSELMDEIEGHQKKVEEAFGRKVNNDERIFNSVSIKDLDNDFIRIGRKAGIPEMYLYATYKTGITVTEYNKNQFSDKDLNDWQAAINEFEQLTSENNFEKGKINSVTFYLFVHQQLECTINKVFEYLEIGISKFLSDSNTYDIEWKNFKVVDKKTYIEYCLFKTLKNIDASRLLMNHAHTANAYATVRFIFETYLNLFVYTRDHELYEQKLKPLIGLELDTFEEVIGNHGKPIKNKFREIATGTIYKTDMPIKILAETAAIESPAIFEVYKDLFEDLSGYVHVNLTLAKNYFSINDLYNELDENLFAGFLSITFAYLQLYEVSKLDYVTSQSNRDLAFLSHKIGEEVLDVLILLKADGENPLYSSLEQVIRFYR
ncbi:hypothetical protein [Planococcus plakortidis]|uniref:hypothetical protein n=1 Tax=Planococcus plakortidis TaxID=1038856 RepID=UPI00398484D6